MFFHRLVLAALLNLLVVADASAASITVALDRWMYPFAFSGGTRDLAPTFGAIGNADFDNRDGQFILGFDTSAEIAIGQGIDRYQINSLTVRAMVGSPSGFIYDPTYDSFRSYLPTSNPQFVTDADPGRPMELHGVGFRNGYTELSFGPSNNQPPEFEENAPFGPPSAGTRNVFPLGFLTPGVGADISNNVDGGFESRPWAIGVADVMPGDSVPDNTTFSFNVELSDDDVLDYLQRGLNSGVLGFAITSLHEASQTGGPPIPQFITKENSRAGSLPAVLEIDYQILPEPSPERIWNVDPDGQASVGSNWTGGLAPTISGDSAAFSSAITANRTVQVDVPLSLKRLRFDDDNNYFVAGPQAITLAGTGDEGAALLVDNDLGNGQHTIAASLVIADDVSIIQHGQQPLVISGPVDNSSGHTITKTGAGPVVISGAQSHGPMAALVHEQGTIVMNSDAGSTATQNLAVAANSALGFGSTQHLASLSIGPAGTVQLTPGGDKNLVVGALSLAGGETPTGVLDVADNALVVDFPASGPNPETSIRQQIVAGRGGAGFGATWSGKGITSSAAAEAVAAEPESLSLGYAVNGNLPLGAYATFQGEPVDDSSILARLTRTGDADLDGIVDDLDVTIVGATYAPGVLQPHWALGDFDYNGFVDDADVTLLGVFYDPLAAPLGGPRAAIPTAVPEPPTILSGAVAMVLLLLRRCRKAVVRGVVGRG